VRRVIGSLVLCVGLVGVPGGRCFGGEIVVSAAASLTNAFRAVGRAFEGAHPGMAVRLNVAASGALLQQIEQGAPVDVFATADEATMDRAAAAGLIDPGTRKDFARNRLVLVVPRDARSSARGLQDLRADGVQRVAVGEPAFVPAGRYARQALEAAGLWETVRPKLIFANSVRQVLDYVVRGEVDAGFVYETDATLRRAALQLAGPMVGHDPILYPIAVVSHSSAPIPARAFADFVLSPEAQRLLGEFGFQRP
jgi:molybdate transport system substrate-binding protein